ncbi:hypothetical protein HY948_03625 [Candidatus Gottesmanbacteria bacterium]|nr:hypothetical protein [Candidatus Gottesmanbacteria bacterium]
MNIKLLLAGLGFSGLGWKMGGKMKRISPLVEERRRFEADVRDQFRKLKEKGLSIPVFTL